MSVILRKAKYSMLVALTSTLSLSACGGGGGGGAAAAPTHAVTISWTPNREAAVNNTGGGYIVAITGQTPISVPYVSGATAPTSTSVSLTSGSYSGTVTAYSALNPPGGTSGSKSAPSSTFTITVP